jgi:hypothetical protein
MYVCVFAQAPRLQAPTQEEDGRIVTQWIEGREWGRITKKPISTLCMWPIPISRIFYSLGRIRWNGKTTQLKDQDSTYQAISIWRLFVSKVTPANHKALCYRNRNTARSQLNCIDGSSFEAVLLLTGLEVDILLRGTKFDPRRESRWTRVTGEGFYSISLVSFCPVDIGLLKLSG